MIDEGEMEELKAQDRLERRYRGMLMNHPDCRDPDHPGCELCEEDDDVAQETDS